MNKPRGYTLFEIIGSVAIVAVFLIVVAIVANPKEALYDEYRNQQLGHVDDYMQSLLQLRQIDEEKFFEVVLQAQDSKVMIGEGDGCDGSLGSECADEELADDCLDIEEYLPDEYSQLMPYDLSDELFSRVRTGYYIYYNDDVLEVGACAPSGIDPVRLMSFIE